MTISNLLVFQERKSGPYRDMTFTQILKAEYLFIHVFTCLVIHSFLHGLWNQKLCIEMHRLETVFWFFVFVLIGKRIKS